MLTELLIKFIWFNNWLYYKLKAVSFTNTMQSYIHIPPGFLKTAGIEIF